jgi:hypothetical protein
LNSFSSGFELFEATHQHCMIASGVSIETPFSRDKILVTLLRGCGEEAAIHAFSLQVARLGSVWTRGFFESFAGYVRQCVCVNADMRLINAYAVAAALPKIKVSTEVLLKLDAIQCILRECIGEFDPPEAQVELVCNYINRVGAGRDGIGGPHISKITEHQVRTFLTLLPQEFRVRINLVNSWFRKTKNSLRRQKRQGTLQRLNGIGSCQQTRRLRNDLLLYRPYVSS